MTKNACIYIGFSTSDQLENISKDQLQLLQNYATQHDITIKKIYQDFGISDKKVGNRPEFKEMIAECKSKEHPFDVILVSSFSRFSRDKDEFDNYVALLNKHNVSVVSISES